MASGTINITVRTDSGLFGWRKRKLMVSARIVACGLFPGLCLVISLPQKQSARSLTLKLTSTLTKSPDRFVHMPGFVAIFRREDYR